MNSKEHREFEKKPILIGMTYCETCSKEMRNDDWRKQIISKKHLQIKDKYSCDLCKNRHSLWGDSSSFKDNCRDAECNHRNYTPITCVTDDTTHKVNQDILDFYFI